MQKLAVLIFVLAACVFATFSHAAEQAPTTQTTTNVVQNNSTNSSTNQITTPTPSDAEMQKAARGVLRTILVVGIVALIGALVVAGFAMYGAYLKFGVAGVIVVAAILAFGAFALGGLLLTF